MNTVKHIALADAEAADIKRLVLPLRHSSLPSLRFCFGQTQQPGQRTSALLPSARVDLRLSVIEERDFPVPDVEAEPLLPEREAPFKPKSTAHGNIGGAELLDLETELPGPGAVDVVLPERFVRDVAAVDIRHDVRDPSLRSGADDFAVRGGISPDGKSDDEELLAPERGDEGFIVVGLVVYFYDFYAWGQGTVAG